MRHPLALLLLLATAPAAAEPGEIADPGERLPPGERLRRIRSRQVAGPP